MSDIEGLSIRNADQYLTKAPEELKEAIGNHDAASVIEFHVQNTGVSSDEESVFGTEKNTPSSLRITPSVLCDFLTTFLSMEEKILTPEGELIDADQLQVRRGETDKFITPEGEIVEERELKQKFKEGLIKYMRSQGKVLTGEGEYIDKDRIKILPEETEDVETSDSADTKEIDVDL